MKRQASFVVASVLAVLAAATPVSAQFEAPARLSTVAPPALTVEQRVGQLETIVQQLSAQIAELNARIASASSGGSTIGFTQEGTALVLRHSGDVRLEAGGALMLRAGSNATVRAGGSATVNASGGLDLKGSTIALNGGGRPVVGVGRTVTVNLSTGVAHLTDGDSTVLVP